MSPAMEAHLRLLAQLPVRTHYQPQPEKQKVGLKPGQKPANGGWTNGRAKRPIRINGVVYKGVADARNQLNISSSKIYYWIDTGKAEYA